MNAAHLHLILAHVPVVALFLAAALLAYAWWRKDRRMQQVALAGIAFAGLIAVPVYFSGEGAEETIEELAGISEAVIERHEEAAQVSALLIVATGLLAAWAGFRLWRGAPQSPTLTALVALAAWVAFGAIGYTANLGGQIRHTEIAAGQPTPGAQGEAETEEGEESEDEDEDDDDRHAARGGRALALIGGRAAAPSLR